MPDFSSPILDYDGPEEYHPEQDEKNIAMLSHILTFFAGFIAPLVIYLIKKDESDFVRAHAIESLNFQLSITFYILASIPLVFLFVGIFIMMAIGLLALVVVIVATVKASEGKTYRYPLTIRLIK